MLEEVLGGLPESSRSLIRERHLDGRSPTEMARARGVAPEVLRILAGWDPGNEYAIPYMWGSVGITYNVDMINLANFKG